MYLLVCFKANITVVFFSKIIKIQRTKNVTNKYQLKFNRRKPTANISQEDFSLIDLYIFLGKLALLSRQKICFIDVDDPNIK